MTRLRTAMVSRSSAGFVSLVLLTCSGCQVWVGDYAADRDDAAVTAALCEVERSQFAFALDLDSEVQLASLADYYAEANPELIDHFSSIAKTYDDGKELRSATYIVGEAGVGKSFVMRRLLEAFPEIETCDLGLAEVLSAQSELTPTLRLPDLVTIDGSVVFNELPGLALPEEFSLTRFLDEHECADAALVLLDGIDEIHPTSASAILRSIEEHLAQTGSRFIHIVVTGRPEGFSPWLADPMRGDRTSRFAKLLRLFTPTYDTRGDIGFRLAEYLAFAELLDDVDRDRDLTDYTDSVVGYLDRFPFLRYSLGNLAVGNVVLQHTMPGSDESERTLKDNIFADLVARNVGTHGRPGVGSRFDATYLHAIEHIAAKHLEVNDEGEFTVGPNDEVPVFDAAGELLGETLVSSILERSGLAYLASPTSTTKRFSFSPFWVHGYLAERYNERNVPKYQFNGCE